LDLTFGFACLEFSETTKVSHIFERYSQQKLLRSITPRIWRQRDRSIFTRIERHVSGVITHSVSPRSEAVEPEFFKGLELKIVQTSVEANALIFWGTKFPLSEKSWIRELGVTVENKSHLKSRLEPYFKSNWGGMSDNLGLIKAPWRI
jgi:hypothetical protein